MSKINIWCKNNGVLLFWGAVPSALVNALTLTSFFYSSREVATTQLNAQLADWSVLASISYNKQ